MTGGLAVRESAFAEIIRVGVHHNTASHDTAFARKEANVFISDVHTRLVTSSIDVAKVPSMSEKRLAGIPQLLTHKHDFPLLRCREVFMHADLTTSHGLDYYVRTSLRLLGRHVPCGKG